MSHDRFIFVGNRRFVLEEMIAANLNIVAIFVVFGSHLSRDMELNRGFYSKYKIITVSSKAELLKNLSNIEFEIAISNGCPFIIPERYIEKNKYINVHPSLLPDLKGFDPVIGSVLFARDSGATCHLMDSGIDTGPVISQVRIPYGDELDVTLLYQLSFLAEKECFRKALSQKFNTQFEQEKKSDTIEYKRNPSDWRISFDEKNDFIIRKVMAYNNKKQGCEFILNGNLYKVFQAKKMKNKYIHKIAEDFAEGIAFIITEDGFLFKKDGEVLRFSNIERGESASIKLGDRLFPTS